MRNARSIASRVRGDIDGSAGSVVGTAACYRLEVPLSERSRSLGRCGRDGARVVRQFVPGREPHSTALLFHGNAGHGRLRFRT
jgi:hypothetical protein